MNEENTRIKQVERDVVELQSDMSDLKIRVAVAESHIDEIKDDLDDIKGNTTWLLRLVVGGIITFILSGGLHAVIK